MARQVRLALVVALLVAGAAGYGLGHWRGSTPVDAAQDGPPQDGPPQDGAPSVWLSSIIWRPTLADAALGLAEFVNEIDSSCDVDVDPVTTTSGEGPEGTVYAFLVTWRC
jgi:hypothetical protein